jgi:predicted AlkP superfamily phosphohydrolase/phosphomutase
MVATSASDLSDAARTVFIGLDACAPDVVDDFIAQGYLPNLARLLDSGATASLEQETGYFVGSTWPTMMTGRPIAEHAWYTGTRFRPEQYDYVLQEIESPPIWDYLTEAGRAVAILDVPHFECGRPIDGVALREYGCHDRFYGPGTQPAELLAELVERHGEHPIGMKSDLPDQRYAPCDALRGTFGPLWSRDDLEGLHQRLLEGVRRKTAISLDLLARRPWDLFMTVYGESHCGGHHFWHLHDSAHRRHDASLAAGIGRFGDPLLDIYDGLDQGVGSILDAAAVSTDTQVLLLLSHGMRIHHDGTHLLDDLLHALDLAWRGGSQTYRKPPPLSERSWFAIDNNTVSGAVRLNLAGREAAGRVPIADRDRALDWLVEALARVVNVGTGRMAIARVRRSDALHGHDPIDHVLGDLLLDWDTTAPIEHVRSPLFGDLEAVDPSIRSGDHHTYGRLVSVGPGVERQHISMSPIDIAPTLAAATSVRVPELPGRAAAELLASGPRVPEQTVTSADLRLRDLEASVRGLMAAHHETWTLAVDQRHRLAALEAQLGQRVEADPSRHGPGRSVLGTLRRLVRRFG